MWNKCTYLWDRWASKVLQDNRNILDWIICWIPSGRGEFAPALNTPVSKLLRPAKNFSGLQKLLRPEIHIISQHIPNFWVCHIVFFITLIKICKLPAAPEVSLCPARKDIIEGKEVTKSYGICHMHDQNTYDHCVPLLLLSTDPHPPKTKKPKLLSLFCVIAVDNNAGV